MELEELNEEELLEEGRRIERSNIARTSMQIYYGYIMKFIRYLFQRHPSRLDHSFLDRVETDNSGLPTKAFMKRILEEAPANCPVKFSELTYDDVKLFVLLQKKKDGSKPSFSTYNGIRSAIFNFYRMYQAEETPMMKRMLPIFFRGLKRESAVSLANGEGRVTTGKDPLSFDVYAALAFAFLKKEEKQYVFAHFFMVTCWNLMCRACSAVSICFNHLEWRQDCLGVYFAHQKTDQFGERPRDARHVYANPTKPQICPILSMGIYFLCFPLWNEKKIFPGGNQYDRFRKILSRLLEEEDVKNRLMERGYDPKEIGTHSMRKGASTFCSSGSTECPSAAAVHLRAGWSLGRLNECGFN